jgi:O-antigen biosynthesis protein
MTGIIMNNTMTVSIVITTWNNREKLKLCLRSIERAAMDTHSEVIVVDNNSSDGTLEMIENEFSYVILIDNKENISAAQATNEGISVAKGKYIIHLDDDIEVTDDEWIHYLIKIAESDKTIGIVGCKLIYPSGKIQHAGAYIGPTKMGHYGEGAVDNGEYDVIREVDYVCGAVFLMKRSLIKDIGMWDEDFFPVYVDETEFCLRAKARGYRVIYSPSPVVIHHQGSVTNRSGSVRLYLTRNLWKLRLIHFPMHWLLISFILEIPQEICIGLLDKTTSKYISIYLELLSDIDKILPKRKKYQSKEFKVIEQSGS